MAPNRSADNRGELQVSKPLQRVTGILVIVISILLAAYALGVFRIPLPITETGDDGTTYSGNLVYGEFAGPVEITFADGSSWKGELKKGLLNGFGSYTSVDGWTYTGEFEEGELLGGGHFALEDETLVKEAE
jgi:hypothetical protein